MQEDCDCDVCRKERELRLGGTLDILDECCAELHELAMKWNERVMARLPEGERRAAMENSTAHMDLLGIAAVRIALAQEGVGAGCWMEWCARCWNSEKVRAENRKAVMN